MACNENTGEFMKKIEIEFSRGGRFTAELLERDAPKTCDAIWNHLPLELEVYQTTNSGQGIYGYIDFRIAPENPQVLGLAPGTVVAGGVNPQSLNEIIISYGLFVPFHWSVASYLPVNPFAKIGEGLDELAKVGQRLHRQGLERISIRKRE